MAIPNCIITWSTSVLISIRPTFNVHEGNGARLGYFLKVSAANVLTKVRKLGNFLALFENISSKNENFDYIGNVLEKTSHYQHLVKLHEGRYR